jgi:hypothetical protein
MRAGIPPVRAAMLTATAPTEWARRLVRGAYDLHVHVEPEAGVRHVIITHPEFQPTRQSRTGWP